MYKNLCNTCYNITNFAEYHSKLSRIRANFQPYSKAEFKAHFDGIFFPHRGRHKDINPYIMATGLS